MKITKQQLKQIIKEEISKLGEEEGRILARQGGSADPLSGLRNDHIIKKVIQAHGGEGSISSKNYNRETGRYHIYVDNEQVGITEEQLGRGWERMKPWSPGIMWVYKKYPTSDTGAGGVTFEKEDNHALLVLSKQGTWPDFKNVLMLSIHAGSKWNEKGQSANEN